MRISRYLAIGLLLFGGFHLVLCQVLLGAISEAADSGTSGGFFFHYFPVELFTGLGLVVVKGVRLLLGALPLFVGALGLLASYLPKASLPGVGSGEDNFALEEPWEYLPQEGRGSSPRSSGQDAPAS